MHSDDEALYMCETLSGKKKLKIPKEKQWL